MSKFTWLFLAVYHALPGAMPTVLRVQADTESEAREKLSGPWSLTFAAKIRTECQVFDIGEGFMTLTVLNKEMEAACYA
ncbi:host cell division inhibitor Icd-like protein [Salmonella enterica subsp. enterica]|uniref:host cell division inhibitor Icd-like protein n=1 Tax=Salmonella enterica TaxID=28901 RepID=UPI00076BA0FE|nr:host cell division inhibitor Icd-like protein [Salmonella enterica]EAW1595200.1 host cell division inhibitor Icd-like protein [Salmonella enterica subsp. enterica]EBW5403415.1 host cell division inhibitor Icd-like protein [Salmonella enterica subsp. enterica serovar Southampton]EBY8083577.1 host cell division inhibitor Icd-like protein [Salmonella enterica subsp. enterica serovar Banana]ECD3895782.1 host cell division inhibitor Icd-like protein [Salmonella enterica subsp. enterica serovar Gl